MRGAEKFHLRKHERLVATQHVIPKVLLRPQYLVNHPLRLTQIATTEQNIVIQDMVQIVHRPPLFVTLRQRPLRIISIIKVRGKSTEANT